MLYQDHLDLRAAREQPRDDVVDAGGSRRGQVEAGHARPLQSIFGPVEVNWNTSGPRPGRSTPKATPPPRNG